MPNRLIYSKSKIGDFRIFFIILAVIFNQKFQKNTIKILAVIFNQNFQKNFFLIFNQNFQKNIGFFWVLSVGQEMRKNLPKKSENRQFSILNISADSADFFYFVFLKSNLLSILTRIQVYRRIGHDLAEILGFSRSGGHKNRKNHILTEISVEDRNFCKNFMPRKKLYSSLESAESLSQFL